MNGRHGKSGLLAIVIAGTVALTGCHRQPASPPPPRLETPLRLPETPSAISVPITARLADLERTLNREMPQTLWSINRVEDKCVPAQRIAVFGTRIRITPDLRCRIVGTVRRGRVTLGGSGSTLRLTLPVRATISAEDIGGLIDRETATGAATAHADIRLDIKPDWTPTAKVSIDYDWTTPPGVTLFGKRITFVDKADGKLAEVVARLERDLPKQLRALDLRKEAAKVWPQAFTTLELNHDNPPVWLRIVPTRIGFAGYKVRGRNLELTATAEALTQTFVGDRPTDPAPTPLPDLVRQTKPPRLAFQIPVLADYAQLEPVVARALAKLAARGITIPRAGPVDARFGEVTIYATEGNRLAVGVTVDAKLKSGLIGHISGRVWLTGEPYNAANSERVEIRDLRVAANTNRDTVNLLIRLFQTPEVVEAIRESLTQDFAKDYAKVLRSARAAIAERRQGDFVLRADIGEVTHGRVIPTGQGLFMPVQAFGTASVSYRPRMAKR
ncbi:DUF4403 family protein [uncultured Sphingomonas sp.]|uniref:DUF4403 family protein n=1 Tax=uncultured Sphingomonas sp. TaxID=158754 RepID=UPI00263833C3|nr:DUF4403 family protein [uncultured Sphingomonas sp.]